jgi:transposase
MDMSDKTAQICEMDVQARILEERKISTTRSGIEKCFAGRGRFRVVIEAGTHSPWTSRLLEELGHEVIVANPRKVRAIYQNDRKSDRLDAQMLARLGLADPKLLSPVRHRGAQAQADLAVLRARGCLVRCRTTLINHVRGAVKSVGSRVRSCGAEIFHRRASEDLPAALREALSPLLETIGGMTERLRAYDEQIEGVAKARYPEVALLYQVAGVGTLTALAYILTLEDPGRFRTSRAAGAYVGLTTRRSQSGQVDKQMRITKAGDSDLRRLLVQSAHHILGPFGTDCDLRRWGEGLVARGGQAAKKRAVVAVARRLAVLLHALWKTGEQYEPLRQARLKEALSA